MTTLSVPYSASAREATDLPFWFGKALGFLTVEVFFLIALGGAVRVMNAGLACPDWPLCFGDYIPDYHPQVYLEFIHRAMAGLVALTAGGLAWTLWRSSVARQTKIVMGFAIVLLIAQVIMGGLTVLLQLHAKVVAAHLGLATAFFSCLLWIYLDVKPSRAQVRSSSGQAWAVLGAGAVFVQILLGGLVASHYAARVCLDFPTCHGQWFPTFSGIIGLHVIHRLGAYTVVAIALANWWALRNSAIANLGRWYGVLVLGQLALGIANVLFQTPPLLSVAHLAMATLILSVAVRQLHATFRA